MLTFFGLTDEYLRSVHKQFHYMKYYGGWSLFEMYNLPVGLRNYYARLLVKTLEKEKEVIEEAKNKGKNKKVLD